MLSKAIFAARGDMKRLIRNVSLVAILVTAIGAAPQAARADNWGRRCGTPYHNDYTTSWYPHAGNSWYPRDTSFNPRYWNNQIYSGYRSGELSRDEVRKLQREEEHIRRDQARFWADGHLSPREREDLREDIRDFRHDFRHQITDDEYR